MITRRRCADFQETKVHDRKVGGSRTKRADFVGYSPKTVRDMKTRTNRRERREGKHSLRDY